MNSSILYLLFLLILPLLKKGCQILKTCEWTRSIAQADYDKFQESKSKRVKIEERWKLHLGSEGKGSKVSSGERNLKNLIAMLKRADGLGWRRSRDQMLFHRSFISAWLPVI